MARITVAGLIVPTLIGAGAVWLGVHFARNQLAIMKSWPKVDAVVTSSEMAEIQDKKGSLTYWPKVTLSYDVGGRHYQRIADHNGSTNVISWVKPVVEEYQPGTHHLVPYNPQDPNDVYVGVGWNLNTFVFPLFLLGFGTIFLLFPISRLLRLFLWTLGLAWYGLRRHA